MVPLSSPLESTEQEFSELKNELYKHEFALGGDWDYEHGMFDRYLDEAHKVWLRIPFQVVSGNFDGENDNNDAMIRLGQPFVLKHLYNEGIDHSQSVPTMAAVLNQFQKPVDPDAKIESKWVDQAKKLLQEVEQSIVH